MDDLAIDVMAESIAFETVLKEKAAMYNTEDARWWYKLHSKLLVPIEKLMFLLFILVIPIYSIPIFCLNAYAKDGSNLFFYDCNAGDMKNIPIFTSYKLSSFY
jgi:hypothetical protein